MRGLAYRDAPKPIAIAAPVRIVAVDLGQAVDYTAITVLTPAGEHDPTYTAGYIARVPLNIPYTAIVDNVAAICQQLSAPIEAGEPIEFGRTGAMYAEPVIPRIALVLDYTGVGRPVLDMFMDARSGNPSYPRTRIPESVNIVPITISGGTRVTHQDGAISVPKRELASALQRVLQERRFIIPASEPMARVLTAEMTAFRAKISPSGHDSYGAAEDWRSGNPGNHDDLVLAVALGLWYGENALPHGGN